MIAVLLLSFAASPPAPSALLAPAPLQEDAEVAKAIEAAGADVSKLVALAESYVAGEDRKAAKQVWTRIVELDPDHEAARKALRHQHYDGRWFESYVELAKYKREEEARMKAKGFARLGEEWVPAADLPFHQMRWTKDASGAWRHPSDVAEDERAAALEAEGHRFRADDSTWVAPADFDRWTAVQWRCGDEWLDTAAANAYHATIERPWMLHGAHFVTLTTCDWDTGNLARWHADQVHDDLVRLFGTAPKAKPHFFVLNGLDQYNQAAGGENWLPDEEGFSSLHGAYFSASFFDRAVEPPRYAGAGVSYWAREDPQVGAWGPFWLRWAAAQSYVDAIDRSWSTLGAFVASGAYDQNSAQALAAGFWEEKSVPRWLRYGAASYVERFGPNPEAGEGADPWDLRAWAFGEVTKNGGLRPIEQVFAFRLSLEDAQGSSRLLQEVGLVVSYLLDGAGDDARVSTAHAVFQEALARADGEATRAAAKRLEEALRVSEPAIRAWAGLE